MKLEYDVINPDSSAAKELPPIIFLHGLTDCRRSWAKTAPAIARKTGRKAYLLDARNHGESPWSKNMDYDVLAQDLFEFMDEHNIKKAVVVGHSMGGRTAIYFALKHPEKVDALIVEDMSPRNVRSGNSTIAQKMVGLANSFLRSVPPEMDLGSAKRMILEGTMAILPDRYINVENLRKHYELDMMPVRKVGNSFEANANLEAAFSMMGSNALVQNLPERNFTFHGDALFLYGSKPFFDLERDPTIKKLFPKAVIKRIDGTCHFIHLGSPDIFIDVVSDFILHRNTPASKY